MGCREDREGGVPLPPKTPKPRPLSALTGEMDSTKVLLRARPLLLEVDEADDDPGKGSQKGKEMLLGKRVPVDQNRASY